MRIRFLSKKARENNIAEAKNQYSTVGFHLMKFSLCVSKVAPPKTTMMPRLTHSVVSTLPCRHFTQATWAKVAAMAAVVAGYTPNSLNTTKNRMTGNMSKRIFMGMHYPPGIYGCLISVECK